MWDPQLPQTHPAAPAAPIMPTLIPLSFTFGLLFPCTSSCVSPFLPTLKGSQCWGYGISTGFVVVGSRIQAFLTVAACPSGVVGSDLPGGQGVPKLLLCPPTLESLGFGIHAVLFEVALYGNRDFQGFFGELLDKHSHFPDVQLNCCTEVAAKEWQDGHCWPPAGQAKDSSLNNSCFSFFPAQK